MALKVGFPCELLGTDSTFKQDLCRHMDHFDMHLQDILVLVYFPTHVTSAALHIVPHHVSFDNVSMLCHKITNVANTSGVVLLEVSQKALCFKRDKVAALALLYFLWVGGDVTLVLLGVEGLKVTFGTLHIL